MKRHHSFLVVFLFLALSMPIAAFAGENLTARTPSGVPQQEKKVAAEPNMLTTVASGEDSEVKTASMVVQQEQEIVPDAGLYYNLQAYNSNEVASKAVERNIGLFSKTIRNSFSIWLSRSGKYLELMKEILRQKDIPENIVFLPLIESGFSPYAYSVAHAAGHWQFIASTAKRYGLEINWWKDERRDPVKSTGAAASYLKDLYKMFGSWNLAMAAYNAGEGRIQKAMKRSKADNYWDLLGTNHIRTETKEYVPRFIAASLIAANPEEFGFDEIEYREPLIFDEVRLDSPIDLSVAAECAGTTIEEIKRLNPELRRWCTPPDVPNYTLKIPQGTKEQFIEALKAIPENERFTIDRYTVRKGETFSRIAKKTGIPVSVILSLNSMEKIMPLKTGKVIYIPPKGLYSPDSLDRSLIKKASYSKTSSSNKIKKASAKKASVKKASVKKASAARKSGKTGKSKNI